MADVKIYKSAALPGTPENDAMYFVKAVGDTKFKFYITTPTGTAIPLDAVTAAELITALAAKEGTIAPGTTAQYWRGDKTWQNLDKTAVGLSNVDNTSDMAKPVSTAQAAALALKADDITVVKLTTAQTIAGVKTFSSQPVVPTPTASGSAANKGYVDTADAGLQSQIDSLSSTVASGLRSPTDINCSANPNYPASTKGDTFIVTAAGKIGGASGVDVEVGDMIVCKTTSASGTQAAVGANFFIVQRNVDGATETISGLIRKATTAEATAGASDVGAMTPLKTQQKIDATAVKFDTAQSLTAGQKTQARSNIGAADDTAVVKLTTAQVVAGVKTFSSSPVVPTPAAGTDAANKAYVDSVASAAIFEWDATEW